jgi:hypothetical protein
MAVSVEWETTVGRLTRGEKRVIIDVLHEPRCNDMFDQPRREIQIRDSLTRVEITRIKLRFL